MRIHGSSGKKFWAAPNAPSGGFVLPSGSLVGAWYGSDYATSPRKFIKNSVTNGTADSDLFSAPRRLFNNSFYYSNTLGAGVTLVDINVAAPDGSTEAATLTSPGSVAWNIKTNGSSVTVTAGQYTICCSVKLLSGSGAFQLGDNNLGVDALTATGSWQRFTKTVTVAATTLFPIMISPVAQGAQSLAICDFQVYAGAADLNANPLSAKPLSVQNGDFKLGKTNFDTATVSSGAFQHAGIGTIQFASAQTPSAFTFLYIAKRAASPTFAGYEPIVADAVGTGSSWANFVLGQTTITGVGSRYNSTYLDGAPGAGGTQLNYDCWATIGAGPYIAAHRYDGATASSFVNGVKLLDKAIVVAAPTFRDWTVGGLQGGFQAGTDIYAMVYYTRALSDAEIRQAYNALAVRVTPTAPRTVVSEGTSLSAGARGTSFPYLMGVNMSPTMHGVVTGTSGATLSILSARASTVDAIITANPTQKFILTVDCGANDLGGTRPFSGNPGGFTAALATYLDARRAAGWKVVMHTIISRLDDADVGVQFNADRATANTTIRTWVGVHCDALADVAGDATIGTDAAPNNGTNFDADKIHPKTAGYVIWEPYTRVAVNSL